jgi:8-oxo-dGTP diphosphatase
MDSNEIFSQLTQLPPERRWSQQLGPVLIVVTLIQRRQAAGDPHYLLIRRRQEPYAGKWALVGGKVEFGETLAVAARREVQEETALEATFVGLRGIVNERLAPAGPADAAGHFLIFVCAMSAPAGMAREGREGAVAWFSAEEIDALHEGQAIIPSDYAMLRQFARRQRNLPFYEAEMIATNSGPVAAREPPVLLSFERMAG